MTDTETVRTIVLAFDAVVELPHFEKTSFRVNKKIFATLDIPKKQLCIKLTGIDQSAFTAFDSSVIYPVPNKWGKQGWTIIELKEVRREIVEDALAVAYCSVAPKKLSDKYRSRDK